MQLLDVLTQSHEPMSLGQLSRAIKLPNSTARRLLLTLIQDRLVRQFDENGLYTAGPRIFEMAFRVISGMDIRTQAGPTLDQLSRATALTVHLAVLDDGEVVYIDKREAREPVRMYSAIGKRAPAHCTALGKALIAFLDERQQRDICKKKGLPRFTPNTITSWEKLAQDLRLVRERGYSLDNAEQQEMIYCVGAPVFDHTGHVAASISLTATAYSPKIKETETLGALVVQGAREISKRLGYFERASK
jgi:DNA-binding IclR family transcriptional regulator